MSGITVLVKDYFTGQEEGRPVSPFSEECCEELWDRVEGVRHKLTRILNPAKLTPYLRQCKVIDEQDEDEVLNSTQYPLRISKAGRLIDILHGRGQRGLQAFMESLEFYHPEQYTQLTGQQPTQRCSIILDEEGPEGLTQFLLLEVRKLREQLRGSRVCERQLAECVSHRLRQDWEAGSRELGRLKDRHLEQAVKYSRALEDQAKASARERELLEQALLDILKQDRREAAEQRHELCGNIARLQGELESSEDFRDKVRAEKEPIHAILSRDSLSEVTMLVTVFQALRSRDSLQLEYTDCLLDKNRLRKRIAELQANLEQQQRELEKEKDRSREQSSPCMHCVSLIYCMYTHTVYTLLIILAQHKCVFPILSDIQFHTIKLHVIAISLSTSSFSLEPLYPVPSPPTTPKRGRGSLADDITIIGGNRTGIFVSSVRAGSPAEQCGLKEGSELLELEKVLFGGGSVLMGQCTGEVAHFSLQWWTEPSSLKHQTNTEGEVLRQLLQLFSLTDLPSPTFYGADSFYVRVNLDLGPHSDLPCLGVRCDDIIHVTDTRYNGKYQWRCTLVNPLTAKPLQAGVMPNYNRAQQLLLVRLRTIALEQKDFKKKVSLLLSLLCHEEHLIPYSMVQPIQVKTKRPVIFSPSLLSRGLIERLLQPAESGLDFNTCQPGTHTRMQTHTWLFTCCHYTLKISEELVACLLSILHDGLCLKVITCRYIILFLVVFYLFCPIDRKLLTGRGEDSVMEEVCQADEQQLETLPLLYHTLEPSTWSCTEDLLLAIRNVIHSQQKALLWVELERLQ
uniref:Caspase recruitment domain family member 10 n=1 Tax=Hucho hucho TaxID=62062 RepID=A0A4W5JCY7_9TELE